MEEHVSTYCGETAIRDIASQNQDGEDPSLGIRKGFQDLATVDLCILVPGLIGSHPLDGNHSLFICEEFRIRGRVRKSEQHEHSPDESGEPKNDKQPLRIESGKGFDTNEDGANVLATP